MNKLIKIWVPASTLAVIASCATPEYRSMENGCRSKFMAEIPPVFKQEMYNETHTREVPTGQTTCTGYGYTINCQQEMRTEYYTLPAVRTVDIYQSIRNSKIQICAQTACVQQYGNAECKVKKS